MIPGVSARPAISELRRLFDVPDVVVLSSPLDATALASLTEREAALVERAVEKRKREFATGRVLARTALARLGHRDVELLNGEDRAPIWPEGISGSISHCNTRAVVAVGRTEEIGTVGVDLEHRATLEPRLWETVFLPEEIAFLEETAEDVRGRLALALFSAKEALYKAQYPRTAKYMGFHELRVELDWREGASEGARACAFQNDVGAFARGTVVHGRFVLSAFPTGELVTAVRVR